MGVLAHNRLALWRDRRKEYVKGYADFRDSFDYAVDQIKTRNTTLNLIILGEFPKHDIAMTKFVGYLKGKRLNRFKENWEKYKHEYQKFNGVHVAFVASINLLPYTEAPKNEEDLLKHTEMEYEYILSLIHSILKEAKLKTWL